MPVFGAVGNLTLGVLGPTTVHVVGQLRSLGARERVLLAALAFAHPRPATVESVADALWPSERPRTYRQVVHNLVSGLRRTLGADALVTEPGPTYRLGAGWALDLETFTASLERARAARAAGDHWAEHVHLLRALDLARGELFADLGDEPAVTGRRAAHHQTVLVAEEDAVFTELDAGEPRTAIARAAALTSAEPYREIRWSLLALAAYRADQRGAALASLARARTVLRDELGLEPGPTLVRLEQRLLVDDPRLTSGSARAALGIGAPARTGADAPDSADSAGAPPAAGGPPMAEGDPFAGDPFAAAAAGDPEAAIATFQDAARSANEAGLFADAVALLARAVAVAERSHGPDDDVTLTLRLARAEQLRRSADPGFTDVMWDVLDRAERAGSSRLYALAAAALCKLGPSSKAGTGADAGLTAVIERALAWCTDSAARSKCAGEATLFFSMTGEAERCRVYFEEALEQARAVGDRDLLIAALGNAYLCVSHPADIERRADLASEMLALSEQVGVDEIMESLHFVFAVQLQRADPLLRTTLARQLSLANTVGSAARRWMAAYEQTCLLWLEGRLDEAEALAHRTFATSPAAASRALSVLRVALLGIRETQGREQELADDLERAVAENPGMPVWRVLATWVAARRGDAAYVRRVFDDLDGGAGLPADVAWSGGAMLLGRSVALLGDVERSRVSYALLRPYAGQFTWMSSTTTGPFDLALGELAVVLGDLEAATRHAAGVARCIERIGAVVYRPDLERLRAAIAGLDGPVH